MGWRARYAALLTNMGIRYSTRFEATGAKEDSDRAMKAGRMALKVLPIGHPDRGLYLSNYAADIVLRYYRYGDVDALDEAIRLIEESLGVTAAGSPWRATMLSNLSLCHRLRFDARAQRDDLELALALAVQAVQATRPDDPNRNKHLFNAGAVHRLRFEAFGRIEDLDAALRHGFAAVQAAPDQQQRAKALSSLGLAHRVRYEHTSSESDLDAAIRYGAEAVRAGAAEHPEQATYLQNVGIAFGARYELTGDRGDLEAAMWHAVEALRVTPADSPDRVPRLVNVGIAHLRRFECHGELADLDAAIDSLGAAVQQAPAQHAEFATYLGNLGIAHSARFHRTGDLADLDSARTYEEQALALTPVEHMDRPLRLSNLAGNHLNRYGRLGDPADLEAALAHSAEAIRATPAATATGLRKRLLNLGRAHRLHYRFTGIVADLDEAIRYGLDAVAACPPHAADRADYLSELGFAHLERSIPLGEDHSDLDAGLAQIAAALVATPADHPDRPGRLADLANAHQLRFTRRADPADIDEAITLGTNALRQAPGDHPIRATLLAILSDAHYERFRLAGSATDAAAMVDLAAEAVQLTPSGHTDNARRLADLGEVYRARAEATGAADDFQCAIGFLAKAVAGIPANNQDRATRLIQLARAHLGCCEATGQPTNRDAAVRLLREAAKASAALPVRRLEAARLWGDTSAACGDAAGAADAYAAAVGLLPLLAWRGLGRAERESRLTSTAGLASLATAWAIEAGRLETAVELLEQGRSVLWAQALQTRTDLTALRAVRPDLADLLATLRVRLDSYGSQNTAPGGLTHHVLPDDRERLAAQYRRDAEAWDSAVQQVLSIPGFETFLAPVPFSALRHAAVDGPVVLINVSPIRCDALIVTLAGVSLVPLPNLDERQCAEHATGLSRIVAHRSASRDLAPLPMVPPLLGLLGWLWEAVCAPILAALEDPGPDLPSPRRLWWSPTGMLSALPLHAAGRYDMPGGNAMPDVAVSSYTPTLAALLQARSGPAGRAVKPMGRTGGPVVLAVGMPTTPAVGGLKLPDLPGVSTELSCLEQRLPCRLLRTATRQELQSATALPADGQPSVQRVLDAMGNHAWAHLACHGGQDPDEPSSAALHLADGPLTVLRIAALDLRSAELAFLSACSTAVGGVSLRDEVIHLAAAMQVAGYRHVVATAWPISDEHAPKLVDLTYSQLAPSDGEPDADRAPRALHHALNELRAELPDRPDLWAAYLHVGP